MVKCRPKRSANPEHVLYFWTSILSPNINSSMANTIVKIGNGIQFMFVLYSTDDVWICDSHMNSSSPRVILFLGSLSSLSSLRRLFSCSGYGHLSFIFTHFCPIKKNHKSLCRALRRVFILSWSSSNNSTFRKILLSECRKVLDFRDTKSKRILWNLCDLLLNFL